MDTILLRRMCQFEDLHSLQGREIRILQLVHTLQQKLEHLSVFLQIDDFRILRADDGIGRRECLAIELEIGFMCADEDFIGRSKDDING